MSYTKTPWVAHETRVTADALNNIEDGVSANDTAIEALEDSSVTIWVEDNTLKVTIGTSS